MKPEERIGLVYRVARLYHEEGLRKNKIAKVIGVTPPHVANLLKEAKERGIVKIKIELPHLTVLQEKLKSKFGLRNVIVIPYEMDTPVLLKQLGQAAAQYFEKNVLEGKSVALGGGYLMYEMLAALPQRKRDIDIYPAAVIGRGPTIDHIDPMILVALLWAKSERVPGRAHYVTVTTLDRLGTRSEIQKHYKLLRRRTLVRDLLEAMARVDFVFASIGALNPDDKYVAAMQFASKNLLNEMKFDESEINKLRQDGVVGDIAYSFFNAEGRGTPRYDLAASLGTDALRTMSEDPTKNVVVVVGDYKMEALRAVLRGKLCNVLITDAWAAAKLLESIDPPP